MLRRAGFEGVTIDAEEREVHLGGARTLEQAVELAMHIGPAARLVAEAPPELAPACRSALAEALAPFARADGVYLLSSHFYVLASKSAT